MKFHGALFKLLSSEIPASLVVFLVAVPLSMGIALASGAPILSGLLGAAVGGIVVGALAGAPLQVSGPAAGLAVIVFGLIQKYGFPALGAIVIAAGALQILFGSLRAARLALAISPAVIHGMLAGIGILIAIGQLHIVLGGTPESSFWKNLYELPQQIADHHGPATLLGVLTIAVLIVWPMVPVAALRRIPAALVAVAAATLASIVTNADVARVTLPGGLAGALHLPVMPSGGWVELVWAALAMALVASAESLLCAVATDKLHGGPRANLDRELVAQGVGNVVSGLIGGLPLTGVVVRSTANVEAGGRTRWSAVLHGLWVVVFVTQLGFLITRIPLASLAALLVVVGVKLVNLAHIREMLRYRQGLVYFLTLLGVVGVNLLAGIGIGIAVALIELLVRLTRFHIRTTQSSGGWVVDISGALTFLGVPRLSAELSAIPAGVNVDVNLDTEVLDHAGFEALHAWRQAHERTGGRVDIDQLHERSRARAGEIPSELAPRPAPRPIPQSNPTAERQAI